MTGWKYWIFRKAVHLVLFLSLFVLVDEYLYQTFWDLYFQLKCIPHLPCQGSGSLLYFLVRAAQLILVWYMSWKIINWFLPAKESSYDE